MSVKASELSLFIGLCGVFLKFLPRSSGCYAGTVNFHVKNCQDLNCIGYASKKS